MTLHLSNTDQEKRLRKALKASEKASKELLAAFEASVWEHVNLETFIREKASAVFLPEFISKTTLRDIICLLVEEALPKETE